MKEREDRGADHIAIVRVEEICPFPFQQIKETLSTYSKTAEVVWAQEEPANAGVWFFAQPRLNRILAEVLPTAGTVKYIGRPALAAPAVGSGVAHRAQQEDVVKKVFE